MPDLLIPIAISSQLDESGEERIHAANSVPTTTQRPLLPVTITGDVPDGIVGETTEGAYTGHGGIPPYSFYISTGNLPDGVTINSDGNYSGTFESSGQFSWEVSARDSIGTEGTYADSSRIMLTTWFLIGQNRNTMYFTTDPINGPWTSFTRSPTTLAGLANVAKAGPNRLVMSSVQSNNSSIFSAEAQVISGTMTGVLGTYSGFYNVNWTYAEDIDVLVGARDSSNSGYLVSTDGGATFTAQTFPGASSYPRNIKRIAGRWVALGHDSSGVPKPIYNENDVPTTGTWQAGTLSGWSSFMDYPWVALCGGEEEGNVIAVFGGNAYDKYIFATEDGILWSRISGPFNFGTHLTDSRCELSYGNTRLISNGQNGDYWLSEDSGLTFTFHNISNLHLPTQMSHANGITIAGMHTGKGAWYSLDNLTWTKLSLPFTPQSSEAVFIFPLTN